MRKAPLLFRIYLDMYFKRKKFRDINLPGSLRSTKSKSFLFIRDRSLFGLQNCSFLRRYRKVYFLSPINVEE